MLARANRIETARRIKDGKPIAKLKIVSTNLLILNGFKKSIFLNSSIWATSPVNKRKNFKYINYIKKNSYSKILLIFQNYNISN